MAPYAALFKAALHGAAFLYGVYRAGRTWRCSPGQGHPRGNRSRCSIRADGARLLPTWMTSSGGMRVCDKPATPDDAVGRHNLNRHQLRPYRVFIGSNAPVQLMRYVDPSRNGIGQNGVKMLGMQPGDVPATEPMSLCAKPGWLQTSHCGGDGCGAVCGVVSRVLRGLGDGTVHFIFRSPSIPQGELMLVGALRQARFERGYRAWHGEFINPNITPSQARLAPNASPVLDFFAAQTRQFAGTFRPVWRK